MVRPLSLLGLGLVMLALCAQLVLGAWVPAGEAAAPFWALGAICHADAQGDGGSGVPPSSPHRAPDCMLCPLCAALTSPAAILALAPALISPRTVAIAPAVVLPPATAPPVREPNAAQPRGPPIQA